MLGELLFIVGHNGVGKTVFAKCLAGLISFDSGRVVIDGGVYERLDRRTARLCGIEYVPQFLPRPFHLDGLEFLALALPQTELLYRPSQIRAAAKATLLSHSIDFDIKLLDRQIAELSTVNRRRLYLIRALMSGARLLILDEPTAGLTQAEAQKLLDALEQLVGIGPDRQRTMACGMGAHRNLGSCQDSASESRLSVLVIAHPTQLNMLPSRVRRLTRHGLDDVNATPLFEEVAVGRRLLVAKRWQQVDISLGACGSLALNSGKIVTVVGDTSKEFHECYQIASQGLRSVGLSVREVPFDGIERRLAPDLPLYENCLIDHWRDSRKWVRYRFFISPSRAKRYLATPIVLTLKIKAGTLDTPVAHLSGGNKQRLLIGRELFGAVDVLVAGDLFRGLDEEGVQEVVTLVRRKATEGTGFLLFSVTPRFEDVLADEAWRYSAGMLRRYENAQT